MHVLIQTGNAKASGSLTHTALLNTSLVSGKASPLNVGIELGVRFELSPNRYTYRHRRKYPCRCLLY